jgi:hypothetical protein
MEFFGNVFTHYNYTTTDIRQSIQNGTIEITSEKSDFKLLIESSADESVSLPSGSPFVDWKEARRFAGPLPFTFTYNPASKEMLIIEGVREDWNPKPVRVIDYHFAFMESLKLTNARLANAFVIRNIPYYWKKGKLEQWK